MVHFLHTAWVHFSYPKLEYIFGYHSAFACCLEGCKYFSTLGTQSVPYVRIHHFWNRYILRRAHTLELYRRIDRRLYHRIFGGNFPPSATYTTTSSSSSSATMACTCLHSNGHTFISSQYFPSILLHSALSDIAIMLHVCDICRAVCSDLGSCFAGGAVQCGLSCTIVFVVAIEVEDCHVQ